MLNLETIGRKITKRRKELNMSQKELSEKLFVTHQAVSKWENGKSIPSIEFLYDLTTILDVSIDYLLKDTEQINYETLIHQSSREHVLHTFLQSNTQTDDVEEIFYLLNSSERRLIIDKMINQSLNITVEHIWHLLSKKERFYLLGVITSNKYDYDVSRIKSQLSKSERAIIRTQIENGVYQYYLK